MTNQKRVRHLCIGAIAASAGWILIAICAKIWLHEKPAPTPVRTERSADDVGKSVGGAAAGFGNGFIEGAKDRLKGK